jgi:hypothetical protein
MGGGSIDCSGLDAGAMRRLASVAAACCAWGLGHNPWPCMLACLPSSPPSCFLRQTAGLAGWLEEQYVRKYMGRNELAYRRWRERQAVFLADNGEAPPLAAR